LEEPQATGGKGADKSPAPARDAGAYIASIFRDGGVCKRAAVFFITADSDSTEERLCWKCAVFQKSLTP
jgi:hypothetical protein